MVMNTQFVKMVIMMNMLNSVGGVKENAGEGQEKGFPVRSHQPALHHAPWQDMRG